MSFVGYFADFIQFIIETCVASFCFASGMDHKRNFPLRVSAMLVATVVLSLPLAAIAAWVNMEDYGLFTGAVYAINSLFPIIAVFFCLKDSLWNRLFCCMSGSMLRMGVK